MCIRDRGILIAPMIERPLPKAIAGPGLLAQIIIDKYVDHLPLHRQMERFKRDGVTIAYSTLTDMVSGTSTLIAPLYEALKRCTLRLDYPVSYTHLSLVRADTTSPGSCTQLQILIKNQHRSGRTIGKSPTSLSPGTLVAILWQHFTTT